MNMNAPRIFSLQAILISLVIHAVIVGVLFSTGVQQNGSDGNAPPAPPAEAAVAEEKVEKEQEEAPPPEKKEDVRKDEPRKASVKAEPEQEPVRPKPVEIRIEPQPEAPKKDVSGKDPAGKGAHGISSGAEADDGKPVKTKIYVVKRGDTLTAVARDCGLTIPELAKLNGKSVKKLSDLKVGQRLKIPAQD